MVQSTTVVYVDDLDGKEIKDNDVPTITFALDGQEYAIDLSDKNQTRLREALAPYVKAGHRIGRATGKRGKRTQEGPSASEVRAWAASNGFDVPSRGRIPASVREAFDSAAG